MQADDEEGKMGQSRIGVAAAAAASSSDYSAGDRGARATTKRARRNRFPAVAASVANDEKEEDDDDNEEGNSGGGAASWDECKRHQPTLRRIIERVHEEVEQRRTSRRAKILEAALAESRDALLLMMPAAAWTGSENRKRRRSDATAELTSGAATAGAALMDTASNSRDSEASSDAAACEEPSAGNNSATSKERRVSEEAMTEADDDKAGIIPVASEGRIFPRLPSNECPPIQPPSFVRATSAPAMGKDITSDDAETSSVLPAAAAATAAAPSEQRQGGGGKVNSSESTTTVTVKLRTASSSNRHYLQTQNRILPTVYLEGAPPPLPPSSSTIFLRGLISSEDQSNLTYVPYFGDDDREDVLSDVYDTRVREEMIEHGSEYQERERNELVGEVVRSLLREEVVETLLKEEERVAELQGVQDVLAELLDVDVGRIGEVWNDAVSSSSPPPPESPSSLQASSPLNVAAAADSLDDDDERKRSSEAPVVLCQEVAAVGNSGGDYSSSSPSYCNTARESSGDARSSDTACQEEVQQPGQEQPHPEGTERSQVPPGSHGNNSSTTVPLPYEDMMDSYRNLFCRRCFTYDCNMHGNVVKPDPTLQGELAAAKQADGYWENEFDDHGAFARLAAQAGRARTNGSASATTAARASPPENDGESGDGKQSAVPPSSWPPSPAAKHSPFQGGTSHNEMTLTALQKSLCERSFLVFGGDTEKMARVLGADPGAVAEYCLDKGLALKPPVHLEQEKAKEESTGGKRKKKSKRDKFSMKRYNVAWLKRVQGAEIHPWFVPCDHTGPCSEESCSCVRNAVFCTKHCVWGSKSRNFFRGCACKAGKCRTMSCTCFAARRECDPDLCRACGACTDPPNKPAVNQRCRNDNIGMRRHCHLLLAKSGIEDAGFGIYTKRALKKGDFVHEYVGEVISQEEAERRGRIYDKVNRSYLFNLTSDFVVDASRKGNKTKFANHSSKPNCCTKLVSVNGTMRIGLFAREDIEPQSELIFDYRYDVGMDNDLIHKPGITVDWMKNPKMASQISKKHA